MTNLKFPGEEETTFYADITLHMAMSNISLMEAVVEWCSQRNIEIEYVAGLISNNADFKAKLQVEAEQLHFLKPTTRVPI